MRLVPVALVALAPALVAGENRLWLAELELVGPLERVHVDCGAEGRTTVQGPLAAGERRTLLVPLPVRCPERTVPAADCLARIPLPEPRIEGGDASARAELTRWSDRQPSERFRSVPSGLLARPRPPVDAPRAAGASPGQLLLLAAALLGGLALRRRAGAALLVGVLAAAVLCAWGASRAVGVERSVLEGDLATTRWYRVRGASDRIPLALGGRLEVAPEGAALAFELPLSEAPALARADGRALWALETVPVAEGLLEGGRNRIGALRAVWVRDAAGRWGSHGPWAVATPLPAARPGAQAPPGWLAAGLPPGTGILLGRAEGGAWLRVSGFQPGGGPAGGDSGARDSGERD